MSTSALLRALTHRTVLVAAATLTALVLSSCTTSSSSPVFPPGSVPDRDATASTAPPPEPPVRDDLTTPTAGPVLVPDAVPYGAPPPTQPAHTPDPPSAPTLPAPPVTDPKERVRVVRVVDGDTFDVDGPEGRARVRVLGMDAPESVHPTTPVECFGPEASARAEELLGNTEVWLSADDARAPTDRYGRRLAHVYLASGELFAAAMIEHGFAHARVVGAPHRYAHRYSGLQAAAEQRRAGMWGACQNP